MADDSRDAQRDAGTSESALGGYGASGLNSRRRQNQRTQGPSYNNLSNITPGKAVGGYASMPTQGPAPQVTTPFFGKKQGPSGPTAMAQGVAGDYNVRPPQVPNWGQTVGLLGRGLALAPFLRGTPEPEAEPEPDVPPFTSRPGGRYGRGPREPKALGPGPEILEGEIVERPALGRGRGEVIDVESWETDLLNSGMPIAELEASQQRALGPGAFPMGGPDRGPGQRGGTVAQPIPERTPAVVSTRASRVRRRPTTVVMQGEGGSRAQTAMGETVSRQVQGRRQQQAIEAQATEIEYGGAPASSPEDGSPINEYFGQSAGPRARRGERNARNTRQQGQLPGEDWGEI